MAELLHVFLNDQLMCETLVTAVYRAYLGEL